MISGRQNSLLLLAVLCDKLFGPAWTCYHNQISSCRYYDLVSRTIIPLPDPDHLEENCRMLREGLECLVSPAVLGNCDAKNHMKKVFDTMLDSLQFPCENLKHEYRAGQDCWRSPALRNMMTSCYGTNNNDINSDYCIGQKKFNDCILRDILLLPNCTAREGRLVEIIVATSYNGMAKIKDPPCQEMVVPLLSATTTTPSKSSLDQSSTTMTPNKSLLAMNASTTTPRKSSRDSIEQEKTVKEVSSKMPPPSKESRQHITAQSSRSDGYANTPVLSLLSLPVWAVLVLS